MDKTFKKVKFDDFPETWRPEKAGESITGIITEIKTVTVKDEPRHLMTLDVDGTLRTVWLNGVLRGKMTYAKVQEGDAVMIEYMGKKTSPVSRYEYNDYDLYVEE